MRKFRFILASPFIFVGILFLMGAFMISVKDMDQTFGSWLKEIFDKPGE
tara:strand:+ start:1151 stop:1297 length:147 start_codon:yes stop_codon:yes gene_type:complete